MNAKPPTEPSADIRKAAAAVRQMYFALLIEGFTEQQALIIIGQAIANSTKEPQP